MKTEKPTAGSPELADKVPIDREEKAPRSLEPEQRLQSATFEMAKAEAALQEKLAELTDISRQIANAHFDGGYGDETAIARLTEEFAAIKISAEELKTAYEKLVSEYAPTDETKNLRAEKQNLRLELDGLHGAMKKIKDARTQAIKDAHHFYKNNPAKCRELVAEAERIYASAAAPLENRLTEARKRYNEIVDQLQPTTAGSALG